MVWAILVIALLVVGFIVYIRYKAKLMAEGTILKRDTDFAEYTEIFTLKNVPTAQLKPSIEAAILRVSNKLNSSGDTTNLQIKSYDYTASLYRTSIDENSMTYQFEFNSFTTSYGKPKAEIEMNKLLTSIEKCFLELDPNTKVSTVKKSFKYK